MSKYYEELSKMNLNDEELFNKLSEYVYLGEGKIKYENFDEIEKDFYKITLLINEVNSGGFDSYFNDANGIKYAEETLNLLLSLKEENFSESLKRALKVREETKSLSYEEILEALGEVDTEFYTKIYAYNDLYKIFVNYLKEKTNFK